VPQETGWIKLNIVDEGGSIIAERSIRADDIITFSFDIALKNYLVIIKDCSPLLICRDTYFRLMSYFNVMEK